MTGAATDQEDGTEYPNPYQLNHIYRDNLGTVSSSNCQPSEPVLPQQDAWPITHVREWQIPYSGNTFRSFTSVRHLNKLNLTKSATTCWACVG